MAERGKCFIGSSTVLIMPSLGWLLYRITGQVTGYCTYEPDFSKKLTLTQRFPSASPALWSN
jgi:hypothetical protein